MADISIPSEIAVRLQEVAQYQQRTIEDVVQEILSRYLQEELQQGSFAEMARIAVENPIEISATDVSTRSRDILENEFADYLLKRIRDDQEHE